MGEKGIFYAQFLFPGIWIVSIVFALPAMIYSYIRVIELDTDEIKVCYPFPSHLGHSYAKVRKQNLHSLGNMKLTCSLGNGPCNVSKNPK